MMHATRLIHRIPHATCHGAYQGMLPMDSLFYEGCHDKCYGAFQRVSHGKKCSHYTHTMDFRVFTMVRPMVHEKSCAVPHGT